MNNVYTVILARLGSTRLPGKMIKQFSEKPLRFYFESYENLDNWPNVILLQLI